MLLTIESKFAFGDRVRFESRLQGNGVGKIIAIMIDDQKKISYMIDVSTGEVSDIAFAGIFEDEIELLPG